MARKKFGDMEQDLKVFLGEWELFIVDGKIWAAGYFTTPEGKFGYDEVCLGPRIQGKEYEP